MKKISVLLVTLLLAACQPSIIKPQIVTVDKPVFSCPVAPVVPEVQLLTPTLTAADRKDPGKVAEYYKADMVQLQDQVDQYKKIIDQYTKSSQQLQQLQPVIDKMYQENSNTIQNTKPAQ